MDNKLKEQIQSISNSLIKNSEVTGIRKKHIIYRLNKLLESLPVTQKKDILDIFVDLQNRFKFMKQENKNLETLYLDYRHSAELRHRKLVIECTLLRESLKHLWSDITTESSAKLVGKHANRKRNTYS